MGFAGNTLDLIRTVFKRNTVLPVSPRYFDAVNYHNQLMHHNVMLGPQNGYNAYLTNSVRLDQDLMSRYADYENMNEYPELGAALDIFADDATVQDIITGRSMWFESPDVSIEEILDDMLLVNLKAEESLWEISRSLCLYGNDFEELIVLDGQGVVKLNHQPAPSVRRIEDINGILYGYLYDPTMTFRMDTRTFMDRLSNKSVMDLNPMGYNESGQINDFMQVYEPWEMVHFRLRGKSRKELYGASVLESARWVWKRLSMIEDAMLLYKISRSPQRFAYYVDVGDVPPNQARSFLNKIKNDFKKQKFIDPNTGKPNFRYNPLSSDEDLFLPVRKGKRGTEVEVLNGPEGQQVEDAEYFKEKMIAALKIPKSYLGGDDTVGRANLSQLDVRFCRTVMRIQRELKNGFSHIAKVDLSARNIDPDQVAFECHMVIPSGVFELAQMEVQNAKLELADKYRDAQFSEYYIWSEVLGLSDEEINDIQKQRANEQKSDLDTEEAGKVREILPKAVDQARDKMDKKSKDHTSQILNEIQKGNSHFAKRMKELKLLSNEIRQAILRQSKRGAS